MKAWLVLLLVASPGCDDHCEWKRAVDPASRAAATVDVSGDDGIEIFEDADASIQSIPGTASFAFQLAEAPSGPAVLVWGLPRETGTHEISGIIVLTDGARIETLGSIHLDRYAEVTERNPTDAYTSGEAVTAVQIAGSLHLGGDASESLVEATIDFDIDESLARECFDCPGFEGCDY